MRRLMLVPATRARIEKETLAAAAGTDLDLATVAIEDGPGGDALADVVVRYRTHHQRTVAIAVNIKRLATTTNATDAASLPQFLQLALEPDYDPAAPPSPIGFDADAALLDWVAGRRKIRDGRDYWLLVVRVDAGVFSGVEAWGVLSGVAKGAPVLGRHVNRAVLTMRKPTGALPDDMAINRELAGRLLPKASVSSLRVQALALVAGAATAETARALVDASDEDLLAALARVTGRAA